MAVLPILDALPMYVAQQEGLFDKHGVKVELIPASSAPNRDQLITAGQADGMINEIVSTLLYNKDQTQVQIVRFARTASPEAPMFRILAAADSGINSVEGLKGVEIGISEGTVIEYLTDRLLQAEGLTSEDIKTIAVPDISTRMSLLGTGELKAGMLPDPLASLAMQQGAGLVLDDTKHPELGHSTYAFRKAFIDENPDAVRGFLAAIEEAVRLINAEPGKWSNLLTEQKLVPAPLVGSFEVPKFVGSTVPDETQWNDVMAWMKEKGLISADVSYPDSVTEGYLPR
jgi:NitT/TauT family transport system substrate-binding protein